MADGGLPASKKLKAADGPSAAPPVVAEDEPSGLLPPSIPVYRVQATSMPPLLGLARVRPERLHSNAGPPFEPSKLL